MPENRQCDSHVIGFEPFAADLHAQELRKHGMRVRLPGQSFQILKMLLERPGMVVTRDELRRVLWPSGTFVDFDRGLSAAVNRLREALGDRADQPRFIETLPRRGYRFIGAIAPVTGTPELAPNSTPVADTNVSVLIDESSRVGSKGNRSILISSSITVAICLVFGAFWYLTWSHRPHVPSLTPVSFTALPGWATSPAFSPDGSRIAFAWSGGLDSLSKGADLYVKSVGSENLLRLTNHPSEMLAPAWSPDGTQIAFQRFSKDDNGIYVVPSQGGLEKKLRPTHASWGTALSISWSRDGKFIAFAESPVTDGHKRLNLLSLETLESSQIEHIEECQEELLPVFSHDGRQLAYECFRQTGDTSLAIATSGGTAPKIVKTFPGFLEGLEWTGDDKRLLFSHDRSGDTDNTLDEFTIADTSVRQLSFGRGAGVLTVAPKCNRVAFTVGSGGKSNIWRADLHNLEKPPVKLISTTRGQACPQYSPDGKHIAFCYDRGSSQHEIFMSDADGKNVVQLTNLKNLVTGTPSWSPDSSKIVFDSRTTVREGEYHADLYIVDIAEQVPRKLIVGSGQASVPSWSHDGKWIYFMGGGDDVGGERIYRVPPSGGRPQVVTSARGYGPQESFDGQSVYFVASHGGGFDATLEVASLKPTGTEWKVAAMPLLSSIANWTVVRDGVYFFPGDNFKTLTYYDFATLHTRSILKVGGGVSIGSSVSPDGHYIAYAQFDDLQTDIVLVDDFR
jgi:Tol biopolymer transport system component/DNA-binding winged helix-turn-helix (wHTH) protein